jgi:uridine kinase
MTSTHPSLVFAVVGGSGAGKTWFVERCCRVLGDKACRLSLDDFYRDRSHLTPAQRARLNFDVPTAIDWADAERALRDCRAGMPTHVPRYDFTTHSRVADRELWLPRPLVFAEGLWLLHPPELRRMFDLTIYLDTPTELRHARRIARDTVERGYTADAVERCLTENVRPMHDRYVEPQKRWADVVLTQPLEEEAVLQLAQKIWGLLNRNGIVPCWVHETFRTEFTSLLVQHEYCN